MSFVGFPVKNMITLPQLVELIFFSVNVEDPIVYSIDCVIAHDLVFPVFTLIFPYAQGPPYDPIYFMAFFVYLHGCFLRKLWFTEF